MEKPPSRFLPVLGILAVAFGVLTLRAGSNVLFGDGASHEGPVVSFVVWFNFLAAFAYVVAGVGLVLRKRWSAPIAMALAASTAVVFALFGIHAAHGGAFAPTTVGALTIRTVFWAGVAALARIALHRRDAEARP